nr:hypothetical protein Iba_chr12aCG9550 [Ipomoea batatas]
MVYSTFLSALKSFQLQQTDSNCLPYAHRDDNSTPVADTSIFLMPNVGFKVETSPATTTDPRISPTNVPCNQD